MKKTYYPLRYRLDNQDRYFIWYTILDADGDWDGVALDATGRLPVFISLDALRSYARTVDIDIQDDEPALLNLDTVIRWMKRKRPKWKGPTALPCEEFLNAWNMFRDISRSINGNFGSDRALTRKIYSKIFWGTNLPAMTPEGEHYDPFWPNREKRIIREVMSQGIRMFRSSVKRL